MMQEPQGVIWVSIYCPKTHEECTGTNLQPFNQWTSWVVFFFWWITAYLRLQLLSLLLSDYLPAPYFLNTLKPRWPSLAAYSGKHSRLLLFTAGKPGKKKRWHTRDINLYLIYLTHIWRIFSKKYTYITKTETLRVSSLWRTLFSRCMTHVRLIQCSQIRLTLKNCCGILSVTTWWHRDDTLIEFKCVWQHQIHGDDSSVSIQNPKSQWGLWLC